MKTTDQKTCLVTGANSGIGKELVIGLAKAHAHVIMVCRDLTRGQAALKEIKTLTGSNSIDLLIADLSSQADIRHLSYTIYKTYPTLNVLINNAGLIQYKKQYSVDGIEMTLATNHLGPFLLTHLLLNLLKKNAPSRIINISSTMHQWATLDLADLQYEHKKYQFVKAYAQSKLLMNMVGFELAQKLNGKGVTVNSVHPGVVKTAFGGNHANTIMLKWIEKFIKFFFITMPNRAAKYIIPLALSSEWENVTGKYVVKGKPVEASPTSKNCALAKQAWTISEKLVGIKDDTI